MPAIDKDDARRRIAELSELFQRNITVYKSVSYNETQTRHQFIDPFFEAFGWDVQNTSGTYEAYKDVIHEDAIKVQGGTKAPDYCFRVGGRRMFFVEAKKPAANLLSDPSFAYQLRRYGWSSHLSLSILTDFEEFAVYDCRIRPNREDKVATARVRYFNFSEYLDNFEDIWSLFAKDSVYKGSLDRYAEDKKGQRGTAPVDKEILREIERWRELLARNIALRNPGLGVRELNFAVQRTIDRIIFLRICEDRGIEEYGTLQALCNGANVYDRLKERFDRAEERYNSGIFHFETERGIAEAPDTVTPGLGIDDKTLADILKHLYFPDSPYEFSMIGADILGQVYEQFLGKVIRLTKEHRAKVEEKPEVRKAGGVYYTPTYIVDYIVRNTVGKLCAGKRPADVKKLRILDPACGSGSFLLGAFQFLIDYCRDWYVADDPEKHAATNRVFRGAGDQWLLTTAEKRELLTHCIYGVDIDGQAVEVTKLNLLLKCLEGESRESISQHNLFFRERALPNLGANIKCGNSLIGTDFFDDYQDALFDDETVLRVNPFDWDGPDGYPEIMKAGGFDAVVGNPPYLLITKDVFDDSVIDYMKERYIFHYKADLFHLFLQKGLSLLQNFKFLGFIVPNPWLTMKFTSKLREHLIKNAEIQELVIFDHHVFSSATVNTLLIFLSKPSPNINDIKILREDVSSSPNDFSQYKRYIINKSEWLTSDTYVFEIRIVGDEGRLVKRLITKNHQLHDIVRVSLGCQAYNSLKHTKEQIKNRVFHSKERLGENYLPELAGSDVSRYFIQRKRGEYIKYGPWLHDYRPMDWLIGPRILLREISGSKARLFQASYIEDIFCNYKTILNINPLNDTKISMKYILGILNSKLISFIFPFISNKIVADAFPRISVGDVKSLPLRTIDFNSKIDISLHDKLVKFVESSLEKHDELHSGNSQNRSDLLQHQIDALDRQIDRLVYELYGLTEEEIRIVEESVK